MHNQDIECDTRDGAAWITINRPEHMTAFRGQTCDELDHALQRQGVRAFLGKCTPDFRRWAK